MKDFSKILLGRVIDSIISGYSVPEYSQDGMTIAGVSRMPSLLPNLLDKISQSIVQDKELLKKITDKIDVEAIAKAVTETMKARPLEELSYKEQNRIEDELASKKISIEKYDVVVRLVKKKEK